jgi:ATP-dependent Clp protease ATP-binding subunit ClpC
VEGITEVRSRNGSKFLYRIFLLVEKGFSQEFGAREMHRVITEYLADPLSEGVLSGRFKKDQTVKASLKKDQIILK